MSVVVPTRNSERTIAACLASIRTQSWPNVELIVVDNASTDATQDIARQYADCILRLGPERSTQRNAGASASRGEFLFFVDSDMTLDEGVIEEAVKAARTADAIVVPETSFGIGFWARCKILERSCYVGDTTIEAARFFRRTSFEAVEGYDESLLATEDWDLHARVAATGARMSRTRTFIQHDEGQLRLRRLVAKKYAYGTGAGGYAARHPDAFRSQRRLLRSAFLARRNLLMSQPLTTLGMLVMKTCEYAAFGMGLIRGNVASAAIRRTAADE